MKSQQSLFSKNRKPGKGRHHEHQSFSQRFSVMFLSTAPFTLLFLNGCQHYWFIKVFIVTVMFSYKVFIQSVFRSVWSSLQSFYLEWLLDHLSITLSILLFLPQLSRSHYSYATFKLANNHTNVYPLLLTQHFQFCIHYFFADYSNVILWLFTMNFNRFMFVFLAIFFRGLTLS